jgi:hypothetical protein
MVKLGIYGLSLSLEDYRVRTNSEVNYITYTEREAFIKKDDKKMRYRLRDLFCCHKRY